jgi:3-phosphoshikimate 1-carboxyvinyltransferase
LKPQKQVSFFPFPKDLSYFCSDNKKTPYHRNLTNTTMRYTISALHAAIQLPASKSISNRALILHSLAHGNILPRNLSDCDDTMVMTRALDGNPGHIDILAAGTAMRFLTAYLSVTPGTRIITGTQRMQQRPIRILVDALRKLGAQIEYVGNEGFPPLRITGTD